MTATFGSTLALLALAAWAGSTAPGPEAAQSGGETAVPPAPPIAPNAPSASARSFFHRSSSQRMLTTVNDLGRYVAALLDACPPRDGAESGPVRRASLREMQQLHRFSGAAAARDASKDRRRAAVEALKKTVGACTQLPSAFDSVDNALRGQWSMNCERGRLRMSITLAPTMPPRVQAWTVRSGAFARGAACSQ